MKNRNHMLDILKGFFILVVIFAHFDWKDGQSMQLLFPFWVDVAVPVFMIVSGYVYAMSFEHKNISTFKQAYEWKFIAKKLLRFYIPFLMIYVIELGILIVTKERTVVEMFKGFLVGGYGPGSYYTPMMIEFVFIFPVIYFAVRRYFFRAVAVTFAINVLYEIIKYLAGMEIGTYRLIILRYLFLIAAGTYMYIAIKQPYYKWLGPLVMMAGFVWLLLDNYFGITIKAFDNGYWARTTCMAACFTIPIVWALVKNPIFAAVKCMPLEKLGVASYNIFLVQRIYYRYFAKFIYSAIGGNAAERLLEFFIGLIICLLAGLVFYKIESKATPLIIKRCGL